MATFQAFVVRGASGPVVTLQAGVDFAGHYWTTTSRTASKVTALRRDPAASVLSHDGSSWTLRAGRSLVIDPARLCDTLRDLPLSACSGPALALLAARYPEQLIGYAVDSASTPSAWKLANRVLIAVRHDDEMSWTDDGTITHQTDRFRGGGTWHATTDRVRRGEVGRAHRRHASLLDVDGACWFGLDTDAGPVVVPGAWNAGRSEVRVPAHVVAAMAALLPGRACVTIDRSDSPRPSSKSGVIARGLATPRAVRSGSGAISVAVDFVTAWAGFGSAVVAA